MRPYAFLLAIIITCLPFASPMAEEPGRSFPPRDDAIRDPGLVRIRGALITALRRLDIAALRKYTHPAFTQGTQQMTGRSRFLTRIAKDRKLALQLAAILERGGRLAGKTKFAAPYTAFIPTGLIPREQAGILTAPNVPFFDQPDETLAPAVRKSYLLISVPEWAIGFDGKRSPKGWVRTTSGSEVQGYVRASLVAPVVSFVLRFRRIKGVWWLTRLDTSFE
jgi:hypothetical protein